jgi:hypothetical protein
MKNCSSLFFLFIIAFLLFSCKKIDAPAFLVFSEKDFENCIDISNFNADHETNYDDYELKIISQQRFRDVLASLKGENLGYWQVPCRIPLIPDYSGKNNIRIVPCVRITAMTVTTTEYPFVEPVERDFEMKRGGEYSFSDLKFEYSKGVKFPILETFVQSTGFSSLDTVKGAPLEISQSDGKHIGEILLDDSLVYFNVATDNMVLEDTYRSVFFWEISYKCDGEMTTYLRFASGIHQDMIVFPSTRGTWKTAYINVTEILRMASGTASQISVRFGIRGLRLQNSPDAYFHFEYIKLISMPSPF